VRQNNDHSKIESAVTVQTTERDDQQINSFWIFLSVQDVFNETLTFLDIRTLIALRLAFQFPESFLQKQIPLLQEKIPLSYSAVIRQLLFSPQQSPSDHAIKKRFILQQSNFIEHINEADLFDAISSGDLDFFQKLKLMIDNAKSLLKTIPSNLEASIFNLVKQCINDGADGFDMDSLLYLFSEHTQNKAKIEECWNLLKEKVQRATSFQTEHILLISLARFAIILKDYQKINHCLNLVSDSLKNPFILMYGHETQIVDCFVELLLATKDSQKINDYMVLHINRSAAEDRQTIYFLTQLAIALKDTEKMKMCLDYFNKKINDSSPSVRIQGWKSIKKLALALQDADTIKMYRDSAANLLHNMDEYSQYEGYNHICDCYTTFTLFLNDHESQIKILLEKLKDINKSFAIAYKQRIISLSRLVLVTKDHEMMEVCFQYIVIATSKWGDLSFVTEPHVLQMITQIISTVKNEREKADYWNFIESHFNHIFGGISPNTKDQAIKHFTQFVISLNDKSKMMHCWNLFIEKLEGSSSDSQIIIGSLIRLGYAMNNWEGLKSIFQKYIRADHHEMQIKLLLLTIYPSLALDPTFRIDPLRITGSMAAAISLVNDLSVFQAPCFRIVDSEPEKRKELMILLNDLFYKRFHPEIWACKNETVFYESLRNKFNLLILEIYDDRPTGICLNFLSLTNTPHCSIFSGTLLSPGGIKMRMVLHEAFGEEIFSENGIRDSKIFNQDLIKHVKGLLEEQKPAAGAVFK